jgi:hypothetical protein
MKKVLLVALLLFGLCGSSYAERIVIGYLRWSDDHNGRMEYDVVIIDHVRNIANYCGIAFHDRPPVGATASCKKVTYDSKLPASANVSGFFLQKPVAEDSPVVVWEVDQNTGSIQACVLEHLCIPVQLVP